MLAFTPGFPYRRVSTSVSSPYLSLPKKRSAVESVLTPRQCDASNRVSMRTPEPGSHLHYGGTAEVLS
jgi:hypothetical protein